MSLRPDLHLDWCSHEAAKYAVEHWHYSRSMPMPPLVRIGVWESGLFIGSVLFSRGASMNLLKPYGLGTVDGCELTRVALRRHFSPVSRIVSIALGMLKKNNPGLRLVISYADPAQKHLGQIYQAGNWIYTGTSNPDRAWVDRKTGKRYHARLVCENGSGYRRQFGKLARSISSRDMRRIKTPGKHRYLMPLDAEIRARILPLAKPYPKRAGSDTQDTPGFKPGEGASTATPALPRV